MGFYLLSGRFLIERPGRTLITMAAVAVGVAVLVATAVMGAGQAFVREWRPEGYGPGNLTVFTDGRTSKKDIDRILSDPAIEKATGELGLFTHFVDDDWSMLGPPPLSSFKAIGVDTRSGFVKTGYPLLAGRFPAGSRQFALSARLARARGIKLGDSMRLSLPKGAADFRVVGLLDDLRFGDILSTRRALLDYKSLAPELDLSTYDTIHVQAVPGAIRKAEVAITDVLGPTAVVRIKPKGAVVRKTKGSGERFMTGAAVLLIAGLLIFNSFLISINQRQRQLGILRAAGAGSRKLRRMILGEGLVLGSIASAMGILAGVIIAWLLMKLKTPMVGDSLVFTVPPWSVLMGLALGTIMTTAAVLPAARRAARIEPIEAIYPERSQRPGWLERRGHWVGLPLAVIGLGGVFYFSLTGDITPIGVPAGMGGIVLFLLGLVFCSARMVPTLVALASRLTQAIFGGLGRLAVFAAAKNPSRTGVTISTFFIAVTVMLGFFTVNNSTNLGLAETQTADLGSLITVSNGNRTPRLAKVKGVDTMAVISRAGLRLKNYDPKRLSPDVGQPPEVKLGVLPPEMQLEGVEPAAYLKLKPMRLVSGRLLTSADFNGRNLYVPGQTARDYGLKVGEELELIDVPLPEALSMQARPEEFKVLRAYLDLAKRKEPALRFKVAGILNDQVGVQTTAFVALRHLRVLGKTGSELLIKATKGVDREVVARRLESAIGDNPAITVNTRERMIARYSFAAGTISSIFGFVGLVLLLGIMSVANTQSANIIERQREFGLLKAVGLTNRKLRRMMIIESATLGLLGSLPGLIAAICLSSVFVVGFRGQAGPTYSVPYAFPYLAALVMVAATALAGLIAGFLVTRKVAETTIVQALRYE